MTLFVEKKMKISKR